MKFFIGLIGAVLLASGGFAQELILPLTHNKLQEKDRKERAERLRDSDSNSRVAGMELPFIDDFSTDKFPGNSDGEPEHWEDFDAFRNFTKAINPPSLGIVTFDGADEYGYPYDFNASNTAMPSDTLTSVPINLDYPPSDDVWFSFFYQGKGFGEGPENGDSLVVQFYAPNLDQWFYAWSSPGQAMNEFEQVFIPITADKYLMDDFQFRFVNYATPKGVLDLWHIDYVQLDRNRMEGEDITDVAIVYPIRTLLSDYSSMPWTHYIQNPSAFMADEIEWLAKNNDDQQRTIRGRMMEIDYEGNSQGTYLNPSEPPIAALELQTFEEPIAANDFNYQFDPGVDDSCAVFDFSLSYNVSPDFITTNNETTMQQEFYSHYAYDDGSPEWAYGANQQGARVAMEYVNMKADSLIGLAIWFEALNDEPGPFAFFPYVWESTGSGPGVEIAQGLAYGVEFQPEEYYGWRLAEFINPVHISEGDFFVGVTQTTSETLNIGLDYNSSYNDNNLYAYSPTDGIWQESSATGSSIMIRPVFQSTKLGPVSVEERLLDDASIYPNPVRDQLYINPGIDGFLGAAELLDLTGKVIKRVSVQGHTNLSVDDLQKGMYLLRVVSADRAGQRTFKFVKD